MLMRQHAKDDIRRRIEQDKEEWKNECHCQPRNTHNKRRGCYIHEEDE